MEIPDPTEWGWQLVDDVLKLVWLTIPEAAKHCYELLHRGCKKGCSKRCKCVKAQLPCTPLCMCDGHVQGTNNYCLRSSYYKLLTCLFLFQLNDVRYLLPANYQLILLLSLQPGILKICVARKMFTIIRMIFLPSFMVSMYSSCVLGLEHF